MASETQLKAALFDLVSAAGNVDRQNAELAKAEDMLHVAIRQNVALRTWKERAMMVVKEAAIPNMLGNAEGSWCGYCLEPLAGDTCTNPKCMHTQARALLAESEASE